MESELKGRYSGTARGERCIRQTICWFSDLQHSGLKVKAAVGVLSVTPDGRMTHYGFYAAVLFQLLTAPS